MLTFAEKSARQSNSSVPVLPQRDIRNESGSAHDPHEPEGRGGRIRVPSRE